MLKYEITIMKNTEKGDEELFWIPIENYDVLVNILLGITNALAEELNDRHE